MRKIKPVFVAFLAASAFLLPGAVSVPAGKRCIANRHPLRLSGACRLRVHEGHEGLEPEPESRNRNRVEFRFYGGGSQGDERDFVRKIRAGQMDAAGVSTTGIGLVARPVLVLTAPGLITEYEQLERARTSSATASKS